MDFDLLLLLLFLLGVGIFFFVRGFIWFYQWRMIRDLPTSKVRSIALGLVELFGTVRQPGKLLKSPFSNSSCTYYRYEVQEYVDINGLGFWHTTKRVDVCSPFFLEDSTGKVLVDCSGAELSIPLRNEYRKPTDAIIALVGSKYSKWHSEARFREYYLKTGEEVYILGRAMKNDLVPDGSAQSSIDNIILKKRDKKDFFFVGNDSEKNLSTSLKSKILGGLFGGGLLTAVAFTALLFFLEVI